MDTTSNWWAVTQPFTSGYRLYVDGQKSDVYSRLRSLTFSPDGNRWACFARSNTQWNLLTNDGVKPLPGDSVGEILFSPNSEALVYSYYEGEHETIIYGERSVRVLRRFGKLFTSSGGERIAFMGYRGDDLVLNVNGVETSAYANIMPIGFWYDGEFVYAAGNGSIWEIFKGSKAISEPYVSISQAAINLQGNVLGATVKLSSGKMMALMISDEYSEPLTGRPYDEVSNLTIHPSVPLIAYAAKRETGYCVVMSSTEYDCGESKAVPIFTHNGDLYFWGCNINCYVSINGKAYKTNSTLDGYYVMKPGSRTIAYTSSTSLAIRYLDRDDMAAGMMVDQTFTPRYNWRTGRYEALGRINQRLYLLTCRI
jgi:hypothetical protein